MLNELNKRALELLKINNKKSLLVDLGCGMGATMRYFLKHNKTAYAIGVTLSDFQVREGNALLGDKNGLILKESYEQTSLTSQSADGIIALESLCHAGHSYTSLKEAYRVLKKGGRFVITDAFLKREPEQLCRGSQFGYRQLCKGWSLDGLGSIDRVKKDMHALGFKDIEVRDISYRVAPSVLHVPFAIIGFLLKKIFNGQPLKPQSWNNLKGSFFALFCGLHLRDFGYYLITATK